MVAGDFDGDGTEDLAASVWTSVGGFPSGVYVAFRGPASLGPFPAGDMGDDGVRITTDRWSTPVAPLGDLDGDGRDDVAVRTSTGLAVVLGRESPGAIDVSTPGEWGLTLRSSWGGDWELGYGDGWPVWRGITAVGDQNGDGRRDLVVAFSNHRAFVLYTPADLRGETLVADQAGTGGHGLAFTSYNGLDLFAMGDVDGDGVEEIGLAGNRYDWDDPSTATSHAFVVRSQEPGTMLDLATAAASGEAFEAVVPGGYLRGGTGVGDQDGDGRRDVALSISDESSSSMYVAHTRPFGTTVRLDGVDPDVGYRMVVGGEVIDVGDQDGDGRADVADGNAVRMTDARARSGAPLDTETRSWQLPYGDLWHHIVGAVDDANGDGLPELASVGYGERYDAEGNLESGRFAADVWHSSEGPEVLWGSARYAQDRVQVGGQVKIDRVSAAHTTALVEFDGTPWWANVTPRGDGTAVFSAEAWIAPGTYQVEVTITDGRGRIARWDGTVTVPQSASVPFPNHPYPYPYYPPVDPYGGYVHGPRIGTAKDDVLKGTQFNDLIRGRRGNDRLWGLASKDVLYGESGDDRLWGGTGDDTVMGDEGRDRIDGGPGADHLYGDLGRDLVLARDGHRDIVRCGGGRDLAVVDRIDAVSRCERLRLPRLRRP